MKQIKFFSKKLPGFSGVEKSDWPAVFMKNELDEFCSNSKGFKYELKLVFKKRIKFNLSYDYFD